MPSGTGPSGPAERKSVGALQASTLLAISAGGEARGDYASLARDGYADNPVAHRCVRLLAEAVAALAVEVRVDGTPDADAAMLLERPSPGRTGAELLEALAGHLCLGGEAWLRVVPIDGAARALHAVRPDRVRVVRDRRGLTIAHEVTGEGGRTERIAHDPERPLMTGLRLFNPLDEGRGLPPLRAAREALALHNRATRWNRALLDNSARPSGALVYSAGDANMSAEQFERLKRELEEGYSGAVRAGRPLLLEGGLDWKAMSLSPRDMDFMEARNGAARDIALALGVPPMLLGIPGDNTYANYAEANRAFVRQSVLPMAERIFAAIGATLSLHGGRDVRLRVDLDALPALAGERAELWRRVNETDVLSADEKRERLGLAPPEGEAGP